MVDKSQKILGFGKGKKEMSRVNNLERGNEYRPLEVFLQARWVV